MHTALDTTRFDYVAYDAEAAHKQAEAKRMIVELDAWLRMKLTVPPQGPGCEVGRYLALARTALEDVYANIGRAIRDEQRGLRDAVPQESRSAS